MKDEEKRVIEDETGATPTEEETDVAPKADEEVTQSEPEPEAEDAPMADESAPNAEPNAEPIEDAPEAEETQDQPMEKMLTQSKRVGGQSASRRTRQRNARAIRTLWRKQRRRDERCVWAWTGIYGFGR